ncbi:MAG: hypothetical protein ACK5WS_02050 [Alphaproteobacteria bacterium]|jgi:hypothetical protein|nr:hypothetical protein [Candidatus Jidaibacter sp.]
MRDISKQHKVLIVTSLQNDTLRFFYDEYKFFPAHLKTCLSILCGVPHNCISFYELDDSKTIEQTNVTANFAPQDEHVLFRIKPNYLLSRGEHYNTGYYCHLHIETTADALISQLSNTVLKKFHCDSFSLMINRTKIFDTHLYATDVHKFDILKDILDEKYDNKIVNVIVKEPYKAPMER